MNEKLIKECIKATGQSREEILSRLEKGEPVQYILGEWEFFGLPFKVGKGVLIPQPDTEILVERALPHINKNSRVLDLCSGSGCIAVAINKQGGAKVDAVELYDEAFCYLKQNISLNGADVNPIKYDVLQKPTGFEKYDIITANPPYISERERGMLSKEVLCEPASALFAEEEGYRFYYALKEWLSLLNEGGKFFFEIGYNQSERVKEIFKDFSPVIYKDYGGNPRVVYGIKN